VTEGEVKIPYDRDAAPTPICQLTTPTPKISLTTVEVSDADRGSTGSLAAGREPVPVDRPNYQRIEGGFEEPNILVELE
jgi:hypothetical protein